MKNERPPLFILTSILSTAKNCATRETIDLGINKAMIRLDKTTLWKSIVSEPIERSSLDTNRGMMADTDR